MKANKEKLKGLGKTLLIVFYISLFVLPLLFKLIEILDGFNKAWE